MTYPNCGMKIPIEGNVCPYCHADKTEAKVGPVVVQFWRWLCAFLGGLPGFAFVTSHRVVGFFVMAILGAIIGTVAGYGFADDAKKAMVKKRLLSRRKKKVAVHGDNQDSPEDERVQEWLSGQDSVR